MNECLAGIFGLTIFFAAITTRIRTFILLLIMQGISLFLIIFIHRMDLAWYHFGFLSFETIAIKAIFIPFIIYYSAKKNQLTRERFPDQTSFYPMLLTCSIFIVSFLLSFYYFKMSISSVQVGVSLATILSGMVLVLTRSKIMVHIIAYMMIENGIFLLSLSVLTEIPLLVELGVLLEIMVVTLISSVLIQKIKIFYHKGMVERLSLLKD